MNSLSAFEAMEALHDRLCEQSTVPLEAYRRARQSIFPSPESMADFVRLHGHDLVACGALLKVGDEWHVRVRIFDEQVHVAQPLRAGAGPVKEQGRDW